jgi:hypothetical protein
VTAEGIGGRYYRNGEVDQNGSLCGRVYFPDGTNLVQAEHDAATAGSPAMRCTRRAVISTFMPPPNAGSETQLRRCQLVWAAPSRANPCQLNGTI